VAVVLLIAETLNAAPVVLLHPSQCLDSLPVGGIHRHVPHSRWVDRRHRLIVEPALIVVPVWDDKDPVLFVVQLVHPMASQTHLLSAGTAHLAQIPDGVVLVVGQLQVSLVTGEQKGVAAADGRGHANIVVTVGPAPAV